MRWAPSSYFPLQPLSQGCGGDGFEPAVNSNPVITWGLIESCSSQSDFLGILGTLNCLLTKWKSYSKELKKLTFLDLKSAKQYKEFLHYFPWMGRCSAIYLQDIRAPSWVTQFLFFPHLYMLSMIPYDMKYPFSQLGSAVTNPCWWGGMRGMRKLLGAVQTLLSDNKNIPVLLTLFQQKPKT